MSWKQAWTLIGVVLAAAMIVAADRAPATSPSSEAPALAAPSKLTERYVPPINAPAAAAPANAPGKAAAPKADGEDPADLLIVQALDQQTDIDLKDVPIRDAVEKLASKTGVPIEVATGTVRFLPYGSQTMVSASSEGKQVSLRDGLNALLRPIGLDFDVIKGKVVVSPTRPLERLARRATWQELDLLASLQSRPFTPELFDSLKFQFQDSSTDDLKANLEMLKKLCTSVGAGNASEVLEHGCDRYGWTWFPSAEKIVIISKPKQIERQLEFRVSLSYQQANLTDALLDLGRQASVLVRFDPGVMATLPSNVQPFTLMMENTSVRQALEVIAAQTGLSYFIEPDGIRLTTAGPAPASTGQLQETVSATVTAMRTNSIVGTVSLPAGKDGAAFSFFVRENDLPSDLNDLRKAKIKQATEWMRSFLETEHSRTSSRPTD